MLFRKKTRSFNHSEFKIKKSLRYKILLVVMPLFLISSSFLGLTAYFSLNNGITNVAKEFIGYQLRELVEFSQGQAQLITDNQNALYESTIAYSKKFRDVQFILMPYDVNKDDPFRTVRVSTNGVFTKEDIDQIYNHIQIQESNRTNKPEQYNSWIQVRKQDGTYAVGLFIPNIDLKAWFIFMVSENVFYAPVNDIIQYVVLIVCVSVVVLSILVLLFVNFISAPLTDCVETIKDITDSMDFSKRVRIQYPDEIGILGQYFNNMVQELEKSYNQIKNYAYQAVLSQQKETRIRFIFQKYVPSDVINDVLNKASSSLLIGVKQEVTILFSDIREFTDISEKLDPTELVNTLNVYFTSMVEQIFKNHGIIDKFIGDAIMAMFGAPKSSEVAADSAVNAAIAMFKALDIFNNSQRELNKTEFAMGIGINTGDAVVGNIGSEQKLDYTVIGDPVNLGARLEGLTKYYQVPILISEYTKQAIVHAQNYVFLNVDTVRVKGKKAPVRIFEPLLHSDMTEALSKFISHFHSAQNLYYRGDFVESFTKFQQITAVPPKYSKLVDLYKERCTYLIKNPPSSWDGVENWKTK